MKMEIENELSSALRRYLNSFKASLALSNMPFAETFANCSSAEYESESESELLIFSI